MNDSLKAKAFDLIYSREVTGMKTFWDKIDDLEGQDNGTLLALMGKYACIDAIELLLELETAEESEA
jgi:hypothetical protein